MIRQALDKLRQRRDLTHSETSGAMEEVFAGDASDADIEQLLTLLHQKGETAEELAGAAAVLRRRMNAIQCNAPRAIDTCGTGGGGLGMMNISTAAAIVASAAGAVVAKHGNRAFTSRSGSADVLMQLGVNIEAPAETVEQCLNQLGLCFCFAPLFHGSVKRVAEIRRRLPFPTVFNLIGPLCNPAKVGYQLLGAGRGSTQALLAEALNKLGTTRSVVVHGKDGLGEVTLAEPTDVYLLQNGQITQTQWTPEDFGMSTSSLAGLRVSSPADSAEMIRAVLAGQKGPARDVVVINAAAALWTGEWAASLRDAARRCQEAIDSGLAQDRLESLVRLSNGSIGQVKA